MIMLILNITYRHSGFDVLFSSSGSDAIFEFWSICPKGSFNGDH